MTPLVTLLSFVLGLVAVVPKAALAQTPLAAGPAAAVEYRVSVPEPEHHWLEVTATFRGPSARPLRLRMSRSSPGRYAVHEFAKNVFAVTATDGRGRALAPARTGADEWTINGHDGVVRFGYRVFGDTPDGTYLGVDTTHAHINMPATFVWAEGLEDRPVTITFVPPPGAQWSAATQLYPTSDPWRFTAPNLQYFMDSPTELAPLVWRTFQIPSETGEPVRFRLAAHTTASAADMDRLAEMAQRVIRQEMSVFGELPAFEPGAYTFILDLVPWAKYDAMEHRNSTYISVPSSLATEDARRDVIEAMAHEFFHVWNVERIRPAGLEPFDFTRENVTCCLWLAEGFTEYYGRLSAHRAGLSGDFGIEFVGSVVANRSARQSRTIVEMSEHGPFADAAVSIDANQDERTFISYYEYGATIALALDLSIRDVTGGQQSLDDFMRELWRQFGKPADARPGYVTRPYGLADVRRVLGDVAGTAFADDFMSRFVEGHDLPDLGRLLGLAGYVVLPVRPNRSWTGASALREDVDGLFVGDGRTASPVPFDSPLYRAGVDGGDRIVSIDGLAATQARWAALAQRPAGQSVSLLVERRDGQRTVVSMTLAADPAVSVQPAEIVRGGTVSSAQRAFRERWLAAR